MTICSCPAASAAFRWIITAFYIFRMFFPSPDSPNRKRVCLHVVFALLFLGKWWQNRCPPRSISRWPLSWTSCLHVCQCLTWLCVCVALLLHLWCVIHSVLVQVWLSSSRTCGSVVLVKPVWNTGRFQIWLCNCFFFFFLLLTELLVLTWPRCVCVWNWMTRIQRCYCNRGGSDGGAVSPCINTFVAPLLKTDDCSRRAQWISIKDLKCSNRLCAIVMMETQLKKNVFLHKLGVHYVLALSVPKLLQFL